jgi:hypothetical protein
MLAFSRSRTIPPFSSIDALHERGLGDNHGSGTIAGKDYGIDDPGLEAETQDLGCPETDKLPAVQHFALRGAHAKGLNPVFDVGLYLTGVEVRNRVCEALCERAAFNHCFADFHNLPVPDYDPAPAVCLDYVLIVLLRHTFPYKNYRPDA